MINIAMGLYICGAEDEDIVMDYSRSQKGLNSQREIMIEEMRKNGLSSDFSDAPVEVSIVTHLYHLYITIIIDINNYN
jgi:hypothetical protein